MLVRLTIGGLPEGSIVGVWAADPDSAPSLDASYHIKGPAERMPDLATFPNAAVVCARGGRAVATLGRPCHGYSSSVENYTEPAHFHVRAWLPDGRVSRTWSFKSAGHCAPEPRASKT